MARLNIEDEFFIAALGMSAPGVDADKIMGNALRFFRHSQIKFKEGRCVSELEYERLGFLPELIGVFAERIEGGYQAAGADKFFSWLLDRSDSGRAGGLASAEARKEKYGSAQPLKPEANSNESPKQPRSNPKQPKQIEASPSTSLSLKLNTVKAPGKPTPKIDQKGNEIIAAYYDAWRAKYHEKAPLMPPDFKKLKSLGENLGPSEAKAIVANYFKVNNKWFSDKRHDVQTLMSNLTVVKEFGQKRRESVFSGAIQSPTLPTGPDPRDLPEDVRRSKMAEIRKSLAVIGLKKMGEGA